MNIITTAKASAFSVAKGRLPLIIIPFVTTAWEDVTVGISDK
jgi:hypothetical protein